VKNPRRYAAGLLLAGIALLASACGGIVNPQGWASPALDGPNAYYLQAKDKLAATNLGAEGNPPLLWTFPDKNRFPDQKDVKLDALYGKPIVDGDTVYLATYKGEAFAIRTADGSLRWQLTGLEGSVIGGPTLAGDLLAFGTTQGRLYVVKKADHSAAPGWPANGLKLADGIWAQPVAKDGVLYVATMGGDVFAFDLKDGSQKHWAKPFHVSGAIADLALLDDSHLFVPSLNKQVYIVDIATGQAPKGGFHASDWVWTKPAFRDNVAYFGDFSGAVYALNITTNEELWHFKASNKVKSAPVIIEDTVVVADRKPIVHFLSARNGSVLNSVPILDNGTVRADVSLSLDGKTALVSTTNGKLFRADPKSVSVVQIAVGSPP
jgi:outer membrane protein assembly factor BamB